MEKRETNCEKFKNLITVRNYFFKSRIKKKLEYSSQRPSVFNILELTAHPQARPLKQLQSLKMANVPLFNEKCKYILSDFEFLQDPADRNCKLGSGSFASVKLAKERKTGNLYALKVVR